MSLEKYATAISRSFWIALGFCAAALIVSTGYDEAGRYRDAIAELKGLPPIVKGPDVYKVLGDLTRNEIGVPLAKALADAASAVGLLVDAKRLADHVEYLHVEEGPQAFNFRDTPSEIIRVIDEIATGKKYVLSVPQRPYSGERFVSALKAGLQQARAAAEGMQQPPPSVSIVGAAFACDQANDQCHVHVALAPASPGQGVQRMAFFVPAERLQTNIALHQVLGFSDVPGAQRSLAIPRLRELERQGALASVDYGQSIALLGKLASEKQASLKMFDLTFSGASVFYALPIAIVLSLGWLLISMRELSDVCFGALLDGKSTDDLRKQAIEVLYEGRWATHIIRGTLLFAPAGAILLLMASVPSGSGVVLLPSLLVLLSTAWLISLLVLRERRRICCHFGKHSEKPNATVESAGLKSLRAPRKWRERKTQRFYRLRASKARRYSLRLSTHVTNSPTPIRSGVNEFTLSSGSG